MNFKKTIAGFSVAAIALSMCAVSAAAADWSQTSYADNDPSTVEIVSTDKDGVTFKNSSTNGDICKARITLDKVLKDPSQYKDIAKMEWTVTYNGVTPELNAVSGLSGGTYATNINSLGYTITDEKDADDNCVWTKDTYSITDSVEFTEPPVEDGELVFMDWSYSDIGNQGVTVTISDFKIYDKDGNEIEQLGYGEYTESSTEEAPEAETETPTEDEKAPEEETQPASDDTVTDAVADDTVEENAKTGNEPMVLAAAIAGIAGLAVLTSKKKN